MIKRTLKLPLRILKRIVKGSSQPDPPPPTRPPPPPQPEPPQWMRQDHEHSHDHGHSHDHQHGSEASTQAEVDVHTEDTPNPNARKYVISGATVSESFSAASGGKTKNELAQALIAIEGVSSVFGINDFVTVTKTGDSDWSGIDSAVMTALKDLL